MDAATGCQARVVEAAESEVAEKGPPGREPVEAPEDFDEREFAAARGAE
jgi:hypothetical protein